MALLYGSRGKDLLEEIARADFPPPWNTDGTIVSTSSMRTAAAECERRRTGVLTPGGGAPSLRAQAVIEEINEIYREIRATLSLVEDGQPDLETTCGLLVHHTSLHRNKRYLLAYM